MQFYAIADRSAQALNERNLCCQGLTHVVAAPTIAASRKIAESYGRLDASAIELKNWKTKALN
jgi:hypothetical protein